MNDTTARLRAWLPKLALLLTLTACGDTDEDFLRAKYGETWKEFTEHRENEFSAAPEPRLHLCGTNDPLPNAIDDETTLCIDVDFDDAVPGSGPATFTLDGTATVPDPELRIDRFFEAGPGHSPGVTGVWLTTTCFGTPQEGNAVHQVSGRLELVENSATRLEGRLVLAATGTLGGRCPGSAAEADIRFDIAR